jgi:thioester reductase-like protein/acyl carrier protein
VLKVILSIESGIKSQKQAPVQKKQLPVNSIQIPAQISSSTKTPKISQALTIISEESGISMSDLTDSTHFGDVGIDSLLGLTITARFKEELDIDVDFNALFFEYPTVNDFKNFLKGSSITTSAPTPGDMSPTSGSSRTGITTPDTNEDSLVLQGKLGKALEIISEESGLSMDDLTDDTNFSSSGVDSLLSLVIVSRFRDELALEVSHEFLFLECQTVGDLRRFLIGDVEATLPAQLSVEKTLAGISIAEPAKVNNTKNKVVERTENELAALASRKQAIDDLVQRYTFGFPTSISHTASSTCLNDTAKVVLITGASGSLGGHLTDQIAQMENIKQVVCLNRDKNLEPYARQQKAMRERGIRSFDKIRPKLLVIQTDSSKPNFGLSQSEYDGLAKSVTHVIHNAWPMSAKRPLSGFESQFQVMRNLIDFACNAVSERPADFKFSFQMVSSVGVVGHYGLGNGEKKVMVPEDRVNIDSVLPNGYGDAKWGCERMLDETLHKHPDRFRTMVVRLGQIAGSKTSGYWNPMEHFGFLIKSSQTLKALPDVPGTVYWTPVNDIAGTLADLVLGSHDPYPVYHIENPIGQSWRDMNTVLADALGISDLIPFEEWVERVRKAPMRNNPAATLLEFLDDNYLRMSCGGLVLDVKKTLEHSKTLRAVGPLSDDIPRKYIHVWKEIGFLD